MSEIIKIDNGIVILNKQKGMTSHDAIFKLKKILNIKKIGHTGTLDKNASGVLIVLLSNSTKIQNALMKGDKEYIAELIIGASTDAEDYTGKIIGSENDYLVSVGENISIDKEDIRFNDIISKIELSIKSFIGEYEQTPPMYSSKKVNGKKLLNLAYKGKVIERKPCKVKINKIEILDYYIRKFRILNNDHISSISNTNNIINRTNLKIKNNLNNTNRTTNQTNINNIINLKEQNNLINKNNIKEYLTLKIKVSCSKGTYIRTLCKDIGQKISISSMMGDLVRTKNNNFSIDESLTIEEIEKKVSDNDYSFVKPAYYLEKSQVLTFGKFETLHIGHKKIINEVLKLKTNFDKESSVLLININDGHFDKNNNLVKGKSNSSILLTKEQQFSKLKYYGIENVLDFEINNFTKDYTPEFFVEEILINQMNAKIIVVGSDCSFGKKGIGNADTLKIIAKKYDVKVFVVDKLKLSEYFPEYENIYGDVDISTTLIKKAYDDKNFDLVNKCLDKRTSD